MSKVRNRVKHWRSQPMFDREILDRLKLDELEFLCRKYYMDLQYKRFNNPNDIMVARQRYKQLCEEIDIRRCNMLASQSYYLFSVNQFDVYTGNVHNVQDGTVVENISFTANERAYHSTTVED